MTPTPSAFSRSTFLTTFLTTMAAPIAAFSCKPPIGARCLLPVQRVPPKDVVSRPALGGLHHEYSARVAWN
jgi:hypothetical protein